MSESHFNDAPIICPEHDEFGVDSFARALAESIRKVASPIGTTIAINGRWGSGKSSAVNLIRHYLSADVAAGSFHIVDFKCWWFRGEEALTLAFLQELNSVLSKTLDEEARDLIPKIGKKLLQAGPMVGAAINLVTGTGGGAVASTAMDYVRSQFSDTDRPELLFEKLYQALLGKKERILVIIDDIDRLSAEESLAIFRLIKSVGRLPNIVYLPVFDRKLAEQSIDQSYPSDGPHFLEKIIQASFEIPTPPRDRLNAAAKRIIGEHCGTVDDIDQLVRIENIFYDLISPCINSPRDISRLSNSMAISYPPIAGNVNVADYLAIETIRLHDIDLYNSLRYNKKKLCGVRSDFDDDRNGEKSLEFFLEKISEGKRDLFRDPLMRLFPRLDNMGYSSEFISEWESDRRICTERHFDTYFRMALSDSTLAQSYLDAFVQKGNNIEEVMDEISIAFNDRQETGRSKIPLLLEELNSIAKKIPKETHENILCAFFSLADDFDIKEDEDREMFTLDNHHRLHWFLRRLLLDSYELADRSKILLEACAHAQVGWLVNFASSAVEDYFPREGREQERQEKCLVEEAAVEDVRRIALEKIESEKAKSLIAHKRLAYILFRWRELKQDEGLVVRNWTAGQLNKDENVAYFARAFTSEIWSQRGGFVGLADRVAVRSPRAAIDGLDTIIDVEKFRQRVEALAEANSLDPEKAQWITEFLEAWRKRENGDDEPF